MVPSILVMRHRDADIPASENAMMLLLRLQPVKRDTPSVMLLLLVVGVVLVMMILLMGVGMVRGVWVWG